MKKITALILVLLMFILIPITAFGNRINIDGIPKNGEWDLGDNPKNEYLIDQYDTNNKSSLISVRCLLKMDNTAYYQINTKIKDYAKLSDEEKANIKVYVTPEGHDEIIFSVSNIKYDDTNESKEISVYAEARFDASGYIFIEMEVTYNEGLGNNVDISVQTTDGDGKSSYVKDFSFKTPNNPDYWAYRTTTAEEDTTKKAATTKSKTVKDKYSTKKRTEKTHRIDNVSKRTTTKKATTVKAKKTTTTAKAVKTTKAKTTKVKAAKTTRKTYTKVVKEKEIYIVEATTSADTTTLQSIIETVNTETQTEKSAFSLDDISRSTLYKIITGICALLLFGVIGVWAVKSKDDNDDDQDENNKEEKTDE